MKRIEYLFFFLISLCISCDNNPEDIQPVLETKVDFVLYLQGSLAQELSSNGFVISHQMIIIRSPSSESYDVYDQYCNSLTPIFEKNTYEIHCLEDQSIFNRWGRYISGPANRNLIKYKTELRGIELRVFE